MNELKKAQFLVKTSLTESDFIKGLAKELGTTVSQLFRDGVMKGRIIFANIRSKEAVRNITGSLSDLVFQMQMAGNNLNQIAKAMNTDVQNRSTPDYQQINDHILNIDASITQTTDMALKLIETLQNIDITDMLFKTETIEYDAKDKTYVKTYEELQRIRAVIADNTLSLEDEQKQLTAHSAVQPEEAIKEKQKPQEEKPDNSWLDDFKMPDWSK